MIFYYRNNRKETTFEIPVGAAEAEPCLCFLSKEELSQSKEMLGIGDRILEDCNKRQLSKFESHDGLDYISLVIPNPTNPAELTDHICIFFRQNLLLIAGDPLDEIPVIQRLREQLDAEANEAEGFTLERAVQIFFDKLTYEDSFLLEKLEEEISGLEEALITLKSRNYIAEIVLLRKNLLAYKRYYDQLSMISSAIEENQNGLLTKKEVRYFRILTNRVDRLVMGIGSLQDYVSQVREAYQTQTDINQNRIMKLFTVITAIFLPLTLLVGWYGMNFDMPEYGWAYGYPMVAVLSVVIALFSILYFKKHKWF